ncbi:MAG: hypothetical protein ACK8QZ_08100, partial [Anaerolineales bacterium]
MQNEQHTWNPQKAFLQHALIGGILFLGLAHLILNFWELPARWMAVLALVLLPAFIGITAFLTGRLTPHLAQMPSRRILLFLVASALLGGFTTWRVHRLPEAYQSITITPLSGQISLMEIKSNSQPLDLAKVAQESNWRVENGIYQALPGSAPLSFSFKTTVDKPIVLLFLSSPQGGVAKIKFNAHTLQIDLSDRKPGQTALQLTSEYRRVPGGLFHFLLVFTLAFTFGSMVFLLLSLQEIGQKNLPIKPITKSHKRNLLLLALLGALVYTFNA